MTKEELLEELLAAKRREHSISRALDELAGVGSDVAALLGIIGKGATLVLGPLDDHRFGGSLSGAQGAGYTSASGTDLPVVLADLVKQWWSSGELLCMRGDCAKMTGRARPCPIHDTHGVKR